MGYARCGGQNPAAGRSSWDPCNSRALLVAGAAAAGTSGGLRETARLSQLACGRTPAGSRDRAAACLRYRPGARHSRGRSGACYPPRTQRGCMTTTKTCWGIYREAAHSPGRIDDDCAILDCVGETLRGRGFDVALVAPDAEFNGTFANIF